MSSSRTPFRLLAIACLLSCASCVAPQPRYYTSPNTPEQDAANRAAMNAVEDESFAWRHRERMSEARAMEMATRHAPRSVTNQSTNILVW